MADRGALFQEHFLLPATADGAIWPLSREYSKPPHFHNQLELLLLLRGSARVRNAHSFHRVHAGQLVWHLPGVEHELVDGSPDCDLRVLMFEAHLTASVARSFARTPSARAESSSGMRELGALVAGRPVVELTRQEFEQLREACDATCARELNTRAETSARLRQALTLAWAATRSNHDDRRALSLVELASCLLLEEPSLERSSVCRALDVSEGYLSRRFQSELGLSFLEQRARSRVVRFVTQINRGRQSYLDAALDSGFGSYSQLHRVFSAVVGLAPSAYFTLATRNDRANWRTLHGPR